ncbi:succinyl-diaminopimelate desuccinylase, partial [Staphylococcus pseudintermedius]
MSALSADDKTQILRYIIEIQSVNDYEVEVAQYLKNLIDKYQINAQILKIENSETPANLVEEIDSGHPVLGVSGLMDVGNVGDITTWQNE